MSCEENNEYTNKEAKENLHNDVEGGLYLHVVEEEEDSKYYKLN
jgi:hypothetical protein